METNTNEWDEMRHQLNILKNKLEDQKIVNARLISDSLRVKNSWIERFVWFEIAMLPLAILFYFKMTVCFHLSWLPFTALAILLVADVITDYKINILRRQDFKADNLLNTAQKLLRIKKYRKQSIVIGLILVAIILAWFFIDFFFVTSSNTIRYGFLPHIMMIAACIGFIIGCIVTWQIYSRMQRTTDEIIRQIEELKKDA